VGGVSRDTPALPALGRRDLAGFPAFRLAATRALHRAHRAAAGPWWFSSSGGGRFDLDAPRGTCYLAFDACTAVRETAGETLVRLGWVSADFARERVVSRLTVPKGRSLADICHEAAAGFGVTREIATLTPYALTRQWAQALADAPGSFGGLRYQSRFTTAARATAVALFDAAGQAPWPADPHPEGFAAAARACGIRVAPPVRTVRIVPPPAP
jgi:hypothetical protein